MYQANFLEKERTIFRALNREQVQLQNHDVLYSRDIW